MAALASAAVPTHSKGLLRPKGTGRDVRISSRRVGRARVSYHTLGPYQGEKNLQKFDSVKHVNPVGAAVVVVIAAVVVVVVVVVFVVIGVEKLRRRRCSWCGTAAYSLNGRDDVSRR